MKRSRNRLPFGMSAGRLVALALGLSVPLAFWAASSLMSTDSTWVRSAGEVSSATAAVPAVDIAAGPRLSLANIPTDDASPEGRLLEIYRLIGEGDMRGALQRAQSLSESGANVHPAKLV